MRVEAVGEAAEEGGEGNGDDKEYIGHESSPYYAINPFPRRF